MVAEALLFGMVGMLAAAQVHAKGFDTETQTYIDTLSQYWQELPCEITRRAWTQANWRSPHIRPANTPERRLAGMAQLLARYRETDFAQSSIALLDTFGGETDLRSMRTLGKGFAELFDTPEASYWSCRSRFGSRPIRVQRLIGRQRALTLVIDALLPLLLLQVQTVGEVFTRAYPVCLFPGGPEVT